MEKTWEQFCPPTVAQTLASRGWQLVVNMALFAAEICAQVGERLHDQLERLGEESLRREIQTRTLNRYCLVLYDACGMSGSRRQQRAWHELCAWLYPIALSRTPTTARAEDCTQQALANIWEHLTQCRDPEAFLEWCRMILIHAIQDDYRAGGRNDKASEAWRRLEVMSSQLEDGEMDEGELATDKNSGNNPVEQALVAAELQELAAAIYKCLGKARDARVMVELILNDKSVLQVANLLQLTVSNVNVIKTRARDELAKCEGVTTLYQEWVERNRRAK